MQEQPQETFVTFVLDETGSMMPIRDDTIGGFNRYVDELKKQDAIRFTLIQFDSNETKVVHRAVPISEVPPLTEDTYRPGAMTPLIDACVKAIKATEEKVADGQKVAIVVQTDGHENASTQHTREELAALVKEKTAKGWMFTFLGAGIDAFGQSGQFGFSAGSTISYGRQNSGQAFAAATRSTVMYAQTGSAIASEFTAQDRSSVGEDDVLKKVGPVPEPSQIGVKSEPRKGVVDDITI